MWAVAAEGAPSLPDAEPLVGTAEQVGFRYVTALPADERAQHGRHYSPSVLAEQLWAMTKRAWGQKRPQPLPGLVLDPACGAGALLLPVMF